MKCHVPRLLLKKFIHTSHSIPSSFKPLANMVLQKIWARQIFDSRGNPTVEVDLTTDKGRMSDCTFSLL